MKKLFSVLLAVCLIGAAVIGYDFGANDHGFRLKAYAASEQEQPAAQAPAAPAGIDYDALYALHEPDEVVMTIGEHEVTWAEYFYYLYRQASSVENYLNMMAMYGMSADWNDPADDNGTTYLELTTESAELTARSLAAIDGLARELGVTLTDEDYARIAEKSAEDYVAACGENAVREDFEDYLKTIYLPISLYDWMNELSLYNQKSAAALYGENGELVSDEDALAFLNEAGYLRSNHILFMTIDPATGEALDEETVAAKRGQAEELAKELQAIEDSEELLKVFAERKQALDEDTGKAAYPDGYIFQPGTMVAEFEQTTREQEPYQVSDPVLSSYGYHVILTLPLTPDTVLETGSNGVPVTARSAFAASDYSDRLEAFTEAQEVVYAEGFEAPVVTEYRK